MGRLLLQRLADRCWADFPLIASVVDRTQEGQVHTSSGSGFDWVFIVHRYGFGYLVYEGSAADAYSDFFSFVRRSTSIPAYFHLYDQKVPVERQLTAAGLDFKLRERRRYRYTGGKRHGFEKRLPKGAGLADLTLVEASSLEGGDLFPYGNFWSRLSDLQHHGYGTCALVDGRVVSMCYSAASASHRSETDVFTAPKFRGLGLAKILTEAYLNQSIAAGMTACWDCFTENQPSVKVAEAVGFSLDSVYDFLSVFNAHRQAGSSEIEG